MPAPEPKRRWFHLSPDRFVVGLLLLIGVLWLSDRFQWFGFNHHKGWTVLVAVAAVGVAMILMLIWWAGALIFARRFQFGIRSVLAFCLACSVAVSWLAVEIKEARWQGEVLEPIRNSGGSAIYDWQIDADNNLISNSEPPGPRWLRNILGDNFFSTVVVIYRTNITDDGLEHLEGLTQLQQLDLSGTKITDAGLEHLKGLRQLRELDLDGTNITDAGLDHLKGLTQLRVLHLHYTRITDAGIEHLKELTQLRVLSLSETNITDAGLEHLRGLAQLRVLYLYGTDTTGAGLERLQHSLPNCTIYH